VPPVSGESQATVLQEAGFATRTPLWYYVLAEAAAKQNGQRLGEVGGTLVAALMVGLIRRSQDSILRTRHWKPTLGKNDDFQLRDLLQLARVL
jgi:hypothetical protein